MYLCNLCQGFVYILVDVVHVHWFKSPVTQFSHPAIYLCLFIYTHACIFCGLGSSNDPQCILLTKKWI